jgi:putative DNA primase/helicase
MTILNTLAHQNLGATITAEAIARALKGQRSGSSFTARCPAHDDRRPSLSIRDTKEGLVLVKCHAGCSQGAVIDALRNAGLWPSTTRPQPTLTRRYTESDGSKFTRDLVQKIWDQSGQLIGSLADTYLQSRGLKTPMTPMLRCHGGLKHKAGAVCPALVARVTDCVTGEPMGLHRTFLRVDGSGKAPVEPAKMMMGPCAGGAVQLAVPTDVLLIGEGIETTLSAMQATGYAGWAALSTSGLRALRLPDAVDNIIILADADDAGLSAAQDAARRWKCEEGRRVRIAQSPFGNDFNDALTSKSSIMQGGAQ